jgi:hypothetical protein
MSIISRYKISTSRRAYTPLRDTRLIIIATEGRASEPLYFGSDLFHNSRVKTIVLGSDDDKSSPKWVLGRMRDYMKQDSRKQKFDLREDDIYWLVIDRDRWTEKELSNVISESKRRKNNPIGVAVSNPCFELWLFLHFAEWTEGEVNSKNIESKIRELLGQYSKTSFIEGLNKESILLAIQRAEQIDLKPDLEWPNNPGTHVYKLVKMIYEVMQII